MTDPRTVDDLRAAAEALAAEIGDRAPDVAERLRAAAGGAGPEAEVLLDLREALIGTRPAWERTARRRLVAQGRAALRAAKRLAIEI